MRIFLNLKNPEPFRRHFTLEGDTITPVIADAEMVLNDQRLDTSQLSTYLVGGEFQLVSSAVEALGYKPTSRKSYDFVLTKWFDSHDFLEQLIVGIPLKTLMNDDLGYIVESGYACRYCNDSSLQSVFDNAELVSLLRALKYNGFVSFLLTFDLCVVSIESGVPCNGLYNILEGCPGKLSDFFAFPRENPLMQSWSVNLMLSCYPYPHTLKSDRQQVLGINSGIEKHFWFNDLRGHSKAFYTDSSILGWSTSWGPTVTEANRRVLRTCRNLSVPLKQHRTDLSFVVNRQWGHLQALGLVEQHHFDSQETTHDNEDNTFSSESVHEPKETKVLEAEKTL